MTDQNVTEELGAAGVPQDAMRRLAELQPGRAGSIFTSDLSVNEFLLVREVGFRPVGLVLGTSIYHVGLQIGRWAWSWAARSTTSGSRSAGGARTRSSTSCRRRCTTPGSWR